MALQIVKLDVGCDVYVVALLRIVRVSEVWFTVSILRDGPSVTDVPLRQLVASER